ncbi:MAG: type III secretion system inner membrane ring subunit SctD [Paracoccaceae bacterium]
MAESGDMLILKVLSGAQYGVEVGLEPGVFTFGTSDECDLQFADLAMKPVHGRLRVEGGKIEIGASEGALSTSTGLEVAPGTEDWHEIAQLDGVTAGTTRFAVARAGADWSRLATQTPGEAAPAAARRPAAGAGRRRGGWIAAVAALAVLFVLGSTFLGGGDAGQRLAGESEGPTDLEAVEAAVAGLGFDHALTVSQAADGRISVTGYVDTLAERRGARAALEATGADQSSRIWAREVLRADAQALIAARGGDGLTARVGPRGELTIEGEMLDDAQVDEIAQLIETSVLGLSSVTEAVRGARDVLVEVQELLEDARLDGLVIARLDGPLIETTGVVPRDKIDNWVGVVRVYARDYAETIPLRTFVTIDGEAARALPLVIGPRDATLAAQGELVDPAVLLDDEGSAQALIAPPSAAEAAEDAAAETLPEGEAERLVAALREAFEADPDGFADALGLPAGPGARARVESLLSQAEADPALVSRFVASAPEALVSRIETFVPDAVAEEVEAAAAVAPQPSSFLSFAMGGASEWATPEAQGAGATDGGDAQATDGGAGSADAQDAGSATVAAMGPDADGLLADLRAAFEAAPEAFADVLDGATGPQADALLVQAARDPEVLSRLDGATAERDAASLAELIAPQIDPQTGRSAPPPVLAAGVTTRELGPAFGQLIDATEALADADAGGSGPGRGAAPVLVPPRMFELAERQHAGLSLGAPPLALPPEPQATEPAYLAAAREAPGAQGRCWPGARFRLEQLPTLLVWMDYFSTDLTADLSGLTGPNLPLLYDLALSPNRVRRCLEAVGSDMAKELLATSVFLAETRRNETFADYLLRNVARFELPVAGLSLSGERYLQLRDGSVLREGMAPDLGSRVVTIGELGALIRVPDGYAAAVFGREIGWRMDDG